MHTKKANKEKSFKPKSLRNVAVGSATSFRFGHDDSPPFGLHSLIQDLKVARRIMLNGAEDVAAVADNGRRVSPERVIVETPVRQHILPRVFYIHGPTERPEVLGLLKEKAKGKGRKIIKEVQREQEEKWNKVERAEEKESTTQIPMPKTPPKERMKLNPPKGDKTEI